MNHDEGYIKFYAHWQQKEPPAAIKIKALNNFRQKCFQKEWIGAYKDKIGYGNISQRSAAKKGFWITGSATGSFTELSSQHFSFVSQTSMESNELWCEGPIVASSESMSHAIIYEELEWVNAVIHIHHLAFWQYFLHKLPTTDADAPYGTPEMANSIRQLIRNTDLPQQQLFVMAGHQEGIFSFGSNLDDAFNVLEKAFRRYEVSQ